MSPKVRILLAIFLVMCINLSKGAFVSKGNVYDQSFLRLHDFYLSANPQGNLSLTRNFMDWEKWKLVPLGNSQFLILSFHGTYLSPNKDKTVKLSQEAQQSQRWTKEIRDGNDRIIYWKSFYGTYLSGEAGAVTLNFLPNVWERWVICDAKVFLRSYHGTYLSVTPEGGVRLTMDLMDRQKWKVISFGNSQFVFVSSNGTYLSANKDQSVSMRAEQGDMQKWTREIRDGLIYWKSIYDTYLSARPELRLKLELIPSTWESWTVSNTQIYLKNIFGTFLSGRPDNTVSLNSNVNDWEKWKPISLGNSEFLLVSFHGTYLSAQKRQPLELVNKPLEWERWTRVEKDGFIFWRSYHGTYLSSENESKMTVKQLPDVTTRWALIDI